MLFLTSLTGFLLLMLRGTGAMGLLLAVHLGVVLALFLSLPYGKFVHGLYRFAALMKYAGERRAARSSSRLFCAPVRPAKHAVRYVRYAPENRHRPPGLDCPLCAIGDIKTI